MQHLCVFVMIDGAPIGYGQHDEPSQLETSLKEIKTFDIYKALEAYPVGRKLYEKAQATFAELKQVGSALGKCRETINKVDLKPSDLETANGMAQHPEALGAEAPLLWTSRSRARGRKTLRARSRSLSWGTSRATKALRPR